MPLLRRPDGRRCKPMTDLERRALLGDIWSQEECTRQGILLPCWRCGGEAEVKQVSTVGRPLFAVSCKKHYCGAYGCAHRTEKEAFSYWNTRPAPPLGRCKDCLHYFQGECLKIYDNGSASKYARQERKPDDFCNYFRAAPCKGDCAECKNADNPEKCLLAGCKKPISTFCSGFEPKENANG